MAGDSEDGEIGDLERPGASWSVIPSARSSQTVRRQEKSLDIDELTTENLLWESTSDLNKLSEYTRSAHDMPVGVYSKVATRGSSKLYNDHGKLEPATVSSMGCLPHPSKLRKRKQRRSKTMHTPSHSQYGFDVTAHVAQLKRKHAEFNWLPTHPRYDITSPAGTVDEEPFPPGSIGPQCVPSTPTLANDTYELHSEHSEWPWQLPTLQSSENGLRVADVFKDYHQPPQMSAGSFSIPSYAVATRERLQDELQDEGYNLHNTRSLSAFSISSRSEQPHLAPWFSPPFSPDYLCFLRAKPLKEE